MTNTEPVASHNSRAGFKCDHHPLNYGSVHRGWTHVVFETVDGVEIAVFPADGDQSQLPDGRIVAIECYRNFEWQWLTSLTPEELTKLKAITPKSPRLEHGISR